MSLSLVLLATGLLVAAVFLEEASAWFGRAGLSRSQEDPDDPEAIPLGRAARESRLLARLAVAGAMALLVSLAADAGGAWLVGVGVVVLLWAVGTAALTPLRWQSPLALAGRALHVGGRIPMTFLRRILVFLARVPWVGGAVSSLDRAQELEEEIRWITGRGDRVAEEKMLLTLHEFGEATVEDVMVRREELASVPSDASIDDALRLVEEEGHTRYPVYADTQDTVIGILHAFDLLQAGPGATAGSLARPAHFTNITKPVGALLRDLQVTYNQMAVVVDEFGGTAGVVTVEDLLEELVGEIVDEHEEEESLLRRIEPGVFRVEAGMRVDDLNEILNLDLAEGEYDTVAGLVLERLERIPHPGERIRENGVWLEVAAAEPHRIQAIRLELVDEP